MKADKRRQFIGPWEMLLWFALRQAAVARYSVWNTVFEGGNPQKMKSHLDAIKALYGF